jgi:hypothetical protein
MVTTPGSASTSRSTRSYMASAWSGNFSKLGSVRGGGQGGVEVAQVGAQVATAQGVVAAGRAGKIEAPASRMASMYSCSLSMFSVSPATSRLRTAKPFS